MLRLRIASSLLVGTVFGSWCLSFSQTAGSAGAPPKVVLLVHQQMLPGKAGERDKLETETCKKFDEFGIPIPWVEMEAVTGAPGALFFDPANSFEEIDRAGQLLGEAHVGDEARREGAGGDSGQEIAYDGRQLEARGDQAPHQSVAETHGDGGDPGDVMRQRRLPWRARRWPLGKNRVCGSSVERALGSVATMA